MTRIVFLELHKKNFFTYNMNSKKIKNKKNITSVIKIGINKFCKYPEHIAHVNKFIKPTTQVLYEQTLFINYYVLRAMQLDRDIIDLSSQTNINRIRYLCENRKQENYTKVLNNINNPFLNECWILWKEQRNSTLPFGEQLITSIGNAYSVNTITMYKNFFTMRYFSFMLKYSRYLFRHSNCTGFTSKQLSYVAKRIIQQFEHDKNLPTFTSERLKELVITNIDEINLIHTELLKYLPETQPKPLNGATIKKNWTQYIKPWYNLLKVFEEQNNVTEHDYKFTLHNILPMYSMNAKYVPFTNPILFKLHNEIAKKYKKIKHVATQKLYNANFYYYASKVFRLKHVENKNGKHFFVGPILTNGDFVSVTMQKLPVKPVEDTKNTPITKINLDDKHVIAVDPGIKNIIYSVDKDGLTCKITNKEYYHYLNNKMRQRKHENTYIRNGIDLLQTVSSKTCNLNMYNLFLKDIYKSLHKRLDINCSHAIKKLKKDAYIARQRTYTKLMSKFNNIYSSNKKKVIAFGNGSFQSSMKGYTSSTYKTFKNKLNIGNILEEVDEHKTSQVCYNCHKEELGYIYKNGLEQHHVRVCNNKHCRMTVLDRDLVGAKNILTVYVHKNKHNRIPYCFQRRTTIS